MTLTLLEWAAQYPNGLPETNIPQRWLDALHTAVADGRIPNIPVAGANGGYPGVNGAQDPICSSSLGCRGKEDIWDAPDGMIGLSVDDGPVSLPDASPRLYDFLKANNQHITHFMIGENIRNNPTIFLRAFEELDGALPFS